MHAVKTSGAIFVLFIICIFIFAPKASAVTLPPLLAHEGLTIQQPLILSSGDEQAITTSLTFGEQKEVVMRQSEDAEVLAETLIVPTVSEDIKPIDGVAKRPNITITIAPNTSPATVSPTPTTKPPTPITTSLPTPTTAILQSTMSPVLLSNGGLDAEKLFSMSNTYRQNKGLPAFQKDDRACQLAASRAPEIASEIAEGHMHSGLRARNLPYWNTENIITMRNEEEAFNWWINDTIHREQIEGNFTYSCVACSGNACAQEFTNFQPK